MGTLSGLSIALLSLSRLAIAVAIRSFDPSLSRSLSHSLIGRLISVDRILLL